MIGAFEWDPRKARRNQVKHGISFEEAATVFLDPLAITYEDARSELETKEITVGHSDTGKLLAVVHVQRGKTCGSFQGETPR